MPTNLVIDADGHCYEPYAGLVKWLPKEYAHLAPNRVTDSSGYSHLMIEVPSAAQVALDSVMTGRRAVSGRLSPLPQPAASKAFAAGHHFWLQRVAF